MLSSAACSTASFCASASSARLKSVTSVITVTVPPPSRAPAHDAVDAAVGRAVLERLARGMEQARHAPGHERVDVAFAVVAVLREIAQERGIGPPRLESSFGTGYISVKRSLRRTMFASSSVYASAPAMLSSATGAPLPSARPVRSASLRAVMSV